MRRARSPVRTRAHVVPSYEWSPKQQRALSMWERDARYVLLDGSVRSGKTFSGMYGWLNGIARNFAGYDFLLSARTMKQFRAVLEANLLAVVPRRWREHGARSKPNTSYNPCTARTDSSPASATMRAPWTRSWA